MKKVTLVLSTIILSFTACGGEESSTNATVDSSGVGYVKTSATFTSNDSNLTWQDNSDVYIPKATTVSEASAVCDNLVLETYEDWRLPTKDEVINLYISHRENLSYNSSDYAKETYYNDIPYSRFGHLAWNSSSITRDDGRIGYQIVNEEQTSIKKTGVIFFPIEGLIEENTYAIRCVREN